MLVIVKLGIQLRMMLTPVNNPLPGFKQSLPVVFCGLYPIDADDYDVT